jgi:eukaryotic-like serine/threonine-protein kinase
MIGKILEGRYEIYQKLGEGGFAKTYLAYDLQLPKKPRCVVKHLNPNNTDPLFTSKAKELFEVEAETLHDLGKHDQIPQLYAFIQENNESYLVLEFIDGPSISQEMPPGSQMSESKAAKLVRDVLEILAFVHERGVIHRDIKPSNLIRRQSDEKIVLIDFGTVKQLQVEAMGMDYSGRKGTLPIGTPGYMSLDQSHGKSSANSDIFALGMVALQALTGLHPSQFLRGDFGNVEWRTLVTVGDRFGEILDKMLSYNPKQRYQTVEEVIVDLDLLPCLQRNALLNESRLNESRLNESKLNESIQLFHAGSIQESLSPERSSIQFRSLTVRNPWQAIVGLGITAIVAILALNNLRSSSTEAVMPSSDPVNISTTRTAVPINNSLDSNPKPQLPKGDVNYSRLRDYLDPSRPNWQSADIETYNQLLRLAGDKSYGDGTFHPDEIANIPCADLALIDQLWSDASQGNLGLKMQKRIYESEGKDWQKMYSKVGWRSLTGEWLIDTRYDHQKFRWEYVDGRLPRFENPPPGHLPFVFREESSQSLARNVFLQRCF